METTYSPKPISRLRKRIYIGLALAYLGLNIVVLNDMVYTFAPLLVEPWTSTPFIVGFTIFLIVFASISMTLALIYQITKM